MATKRPLSLQWRVTLLVGLVISLGLMVLGWTVQQAIGHHFAEQDAHELGVVIQAVERALSARPPQPDSPRHNHADHDHVEHTTAASAAGDPPPDPQGSAPVTHLDDHQQHALQPLLQQAAQGHHGVYWSLWTAAGVPLFATSGPDLKPLLNDPSTPLPVQTPSANPQLTERWIDERELRVARIQLGDMQLLLASDQTFHRHFLDDFQQRLLLLTALIGLVTLLAVWFSIQRGHAPLRQLSDQIGHIGSQHLHQRLDPDASPAELQALIQAFNAMLGRIEGGFERLSNFSADIAHELRTPLAALITQTQVALAQQRSADEYRELLYSSLEEEERLSRMVADMLWLAKTDNGLLHLRLQPLNLAQEVNDLAEFFEAWADEQSVQLICQGQAPGVMADRDTVRRAIGNLLSNAIRYTGAHQTVTLQLAEQTVNHQSFATVAVENPGPAIPPEHLPHLFERFYRVDSSRQRSTDGTGLGLAITHSIAQLHGGRVTVSSDADNTRFTLWLPQPPAGS